MSDVNDPAAWVVYAEEDYTMARSALRRKQPFTYSACFHAQQCAEKYLKALLVSRGAEFPKTHDLLLLSGLCERIGILVAVDAKRLNTLSDYAVRARYPGEEPTPEDARDAYATAQVVRHFARALLGSS